MKFLKYFCGANAISEISFVSAGSMTPLNSFGFVNDTAEIVLSGSMTPLK
jgi:hypothetical protein